MTNYLWSIKYRVFKRPIRLKKLHDNNSGHPVVFLHGIGKTGNVWRHVTDNLSSFNNYRIIVYDLLGFGASPKPNWLNYTVDDHANAVINSIYSLNLTEPITLVGHSMGCLIAVRVARLKPELIKHLVLYEMPLYNGLPEKRLYKLRLGFYSKFYNWIINYEPNFTEEGKRRSQKIASRVIGFEVDKKTWQPFIKSLKNTVLKQTADDDIKNINIPMDVIYGSYDMFVIHGHVEKVYGKLPEHINSHSVRARHVISVKASKLITDRIVGYYTNSG